MKAPNKPNLSSLRERKFSQAVQHHRHKPNPVLAGMIDSKLFSLDGNAVFRYRPDILGAKEYEMFISSSEKTP